MAGPDDLTFSTPTMTAIFSPESRVRHMLDFEAALARAEARAGVIPAEAATAIAAACQVKDFDLAALEREAAIAGTPAIPLVRMLTALVAGNAGRFVHWGATSQDAVDTALVLQMREGL
ncbi:MAG: lyase family protein, partial [Thermomicrobiales bacterium]